jgi:hypothetical protein
MSIIFELLSTTYNILFAQKPIQEMGNRQYIIIRFIHGQGEKNQSKTKKSMTTWITLENSKSRINNYIFNYAIR